MQVATLISVQVGAPQTLTTPALPNGERPEWTTAIYKQPVSAELWLGTTNLQGDRQANVEKHGGPEKAVLCASADHFDDWRHEHGLEVSPGSFGENFTISGLNEETACIGDVYQIGGAVVQVAQPRSPCAKLARKLQRSDAIKITMANGKLGWYLRVLQEGFVSAGEAIVLRHRPCPQWSVRRAGRVYFNRNVAREEIEAMLALPLLGASWKDRIRNKFQVMVPA